MSLWVRNQHYQVKHWLINLPSGHAVWSWSLPGSMDIFPLEKEVPPMPRGYAAYAPEFWQQMVEWSVPKSDCDLNDCSAMAKSGERFGR
jgi:hypothetical protein